jgi:hypothetical protein
MMGQCCSCLVHVFLCFYPLGLAICFTVEGSVLSVDFSPDMGSQSSECRCVWALLLCRQITVMAAPLHASLALIGYLLYL